MPTSRIATLLPEDCAASETDGDENGRLAAEEEAALGPACEVRVREFTLGRLCARRALEALGHAPVPILRGPGREPLWPDGLVGSITHTRRYCAAVVAPRTRLVSVGI